MRKLTEEDHEKVWPFVQQEASKNLFIIGDIEAYGYEQDFQELWGEFDRSGNLMAILLRYYESFIVYGTKGYDAEGMMRIIEKYKHSMISGGREVLEELETILPEGSYSPRDTYFAECTKDSLALPGKINLSEEIKRANSKDAYKIATLEGNIAEFESLKNVPIHEREKQIKKKFESKAGRTYFIEKDNQILSMVSTSAENTVSAMIMGVCTKLECRNRGYVSAMLPVLLTDLFNEKETACLFYDNPEAGNIYKRNGFKDIGIWRMLRKV